MRSRRHGPDIDFTALGGSSPVHARLVTLAALAGVDAHGHGRRRSLDAGYSLRFGFVPQRAFQGQPASLSVVVRPSGIRCAASIRYADATLQRLPSVVARAGRASWQLGDPRQGEDRLGDRRRLVRQGRQVARAFTVAGPPSAPARVVVLKNGFSQRVVYSSREGQLRHRALEPVARERRARASTCQVNFIDATNRVVQTEHSRHCDRRRARSTTSAARRRSPTRRRSRSSRS